MTDRAQFHAERRTGIGGSDAAALLGVHPYLTALDVYINKLSTDPPPEDEEMREAAYWGQKLEPILRDEYGHRTGFRIQFPTDLEPLFFRHPQHEFIVGHFDGLVFDGQELVRGLETKTASAYLRREWEDDAPIHYIVQCQHYMSLDPDLGAFDLAVLIGGQLFKIITIERDPEFIADLIEIEREFWNECVLALNPPPAERNEKGRRALSRLYPVENLEERVAEGALIELAEDLAKARQRARLAEERKIAAENLMKEAMGRTAVVVGNDWKVSWTKNRDTRVTDWKEAFWDLAQRAPIISQDERAEILAAHTVTRPGPRVFRAYVDSLTEEVAP